MGNLLEYDQEGIITRFDGAKPSTALPRASPIASFYRNTIVHFFWQEQSLSLRFSRLANNAITLRH